MNIENNLTKLRVSIGKDKLLLLALFRQMDRGSKGYLVLDDFRNYISTLGGDSLKDIDLSAIFNRISR